MTSSQDGGAATLHRVRHGGRQVVSVQHVKVAGGGQAVVAGNVDRTTGVGVGSSVKSDDGSHVKRGRIAAGFADHGLGDIDQHEIMAVDANPVTPCVTDSQAIS